MAYLFTDEDGDEAVKFERGHWDSFWGYECPVCRTNIGDPIAAMEHENELPCEEAPDDYQGLLYSGQA